MDDYTTAVRRAAAQQRLNPAGRQPAARVAQGIAAVLRRLDAAALRAQLADRLPHRAARHAEPLGQQLAADKAVLRRKALEQRVLCLQHHISLSFDVSFSES